VTAVTKIPRPLIIAIEGLDASGKSTQAHRLVADIKTSGRTVTELSFPRYETFFGSRIGTLLSGSEETTAATLDPRSMALWFAMDRWDAMRSGSNNGMPDVDVVVLNRWTLSNAVYQGARADALGEADAVFDWVLELEQHVLGLPVPALTLLLDISVQTSMQRAADRAASTGAQPDVYESKAALLHTSRRLYQRAATHGHGTVVNVDNRTPTEVHEAIRLLVNKLF
jgi:dTMP kinase